MLDFSAARFIQRRSVRACAFFFVQYSIRVLLVRFFFFLHIQDCGPRNTCDRCAGIPICAWLWVIHFAVVRPICVVELQENASGMYLT